MRVRLATILVCLAVSAIAVPAALADPAADAGAVSTAFVNALYDGNAQSACGMVSSGFLAHVGGTTAACAQLFAADDQSGEQDGEARTALQEAWLNATSVALSHAGVFPMPARRLARELNDSLEGTRVVLGAGPSAAMNHPADVLVLDTKQTTKRRIVLYLESDSGQIWQLVGTPTTAHGASVTRAAKGVPATVESEPITIAVQSAYLTPVGADVTVVLSEGDESYAILLQLVQENGVWKVKDLLVSLTSSLGQHLL
jgi:hypothetical protein